MRQVFLDTSIQIARWIREPEMKQRINDRLKQYDATATSLVVRQEFKRRLLKEAQYLLNQLNHKGSLERVQRHIVSVLPLQHQRKRNICLEMLTALFEEKDDNQRTDRAKRYLRTLLRVGLTDFDNSVNKIIQDSGCACSHFPVEEKIPYLKYEFGPDKCSVTGSACGVSDFLNKNQYAIERIRTYLQKLPEDKKSAELRSAEDFIEKLLDSSIIVEEMNPCLTVGDLIIALESAGISDFHTFHTFNSKESQHLCRALGQSLVVRPRNPVHDDEVCLAADEKWREF